MRTLPRHPRTLRYAAAAALLVACTRLAAAQETTAPSAESKAAAAEADEEMPPPARETLPLEQQPSLIYLPDDDGKLRPVPGFDLDRLIELYQVQRGIEQQSRPPDYSIAEIHIRGHAAGDRAELTGEFDIAIHGTGWVRVPLRLADALLGEPAQFDGPGEHMVKVAQEGNGYEVWIRSEPDTSHKVTMRLLSPVEQIGAESRLRLNLPRAPLAQLDLKVPLKRAVARVSDGSTLVDVKPAADDATQLSVVGLSGEFELTWQAADTPVARLPTVLEATGAVTLRIDGQSVNSDAKLMVRSTGGEFDSFQVRLPPGAELTPNPPGALSVVPIDAQDGGGQLCEVKLSRKSVGPVELRLMTQRAITAQKDDAPLELAGFEVIDAVRQSGTVTVQVAGDWQIQWAEMRHVRQTDELTGMLGGGDPTAVFEYSAQPYSLSARVRPQETRRRVEADYVVLVGSNEAELRARLKYTIRGAKVRTLEVDAPGWNVDLLGPGNLVNVDAVIAGQNNPLVIPLLQATSGEIEVTFEARQQIPAESGKISLRVPMPRGESVAAANVTIVAADNVELFIEPDEASGLARQPVPPQTTDLPQRQQEPLYFRTAGDAPSIVASVKLHRQEVSSAAKTEIEVDEQTAMVQQQLAYQISYEPADHLLLSVPAALRADDLAITVDGQRVTALPQRERAGEAAASAPMRVRLPAPRIGRCDVQIGYTVGHAALTPDASTLVDVPLVIPADGILTANELNITAKPGVSVTYPKGPWVAPASQLRSASPTALRLTAASAIPHVALAATIKQRQLEDNTTVEAAWIETWLTDARRHDRAVFRVNTTEPTLKVLLPAGARLASLEFDGRRLGQQPETSGTMPELTVAVPESSNDQHLLELRYFLDERPPRGSLALQPPRIDSAGWTQHLYWQLVLPATEHVFSGPASYAREYQWQWSGLMWRRQPSLDERDLETWIGAAPSSASLPAGDRDAAKGTRDHLGDSANRYLFSTLGAAEPLQLTTVSRTRLVLWASLPLLLCGLVLIYWPATRHPATILVAAVAVAAVAVIDPESAVLLAQAAMLGLVLALVAFLLARTTGRRPVVAATPMRGSSQSLERPHTASYVRPASGSQPSTATNPLVPSSAPESNS